LIDYPNERTPTIQKLPEMWHDPTYSSKSKKLSVYPQKKKVVSEAKHENYADTSAQRMVSNRLSY
jgi:hypothetical protein